MGTRIAALAVAFCVLWAGAIPVAYGQASAAQNESSDARIASNQELAVLHPRQDTYIRDFDPDGVFADEDELRLFREDLQAVANEHLLLQFDLDTLPEGASIQNATLRLFQREVRGNLPIAIDRIAEPWDAGKTSWGNQPDTTFYRGPAFVDTATGIFVDWDMTDLAIAWREQPANMPNYGLLLRLDQGQDTPSLRVFDSSRGENPPELRILYTPAEVGIPGDAPSLRLDPECVVNNERYKDGAVFSFPDEGGSDSGQVYLIHDEQYLYVCVAGEGVRERFFGVYIDTSLDDVGVPADLPGEEHISLRINVADGELEAVRGTDNPDMPYAADETIRGWQAVAAPPPLSIGPISAEYQIPLALLGPRVQCGAQFGLAVYHQSSDQFANAFGWPRRESPDIPSTWVGARLQNATCIRVICTETNAPCSPAADVQVLDADTGDRYTVDVAGYVQERSDIENGVRIWARTPVMTGEELPFTVYHTSGAPQTVDDGAFADPPQGEITLRIGPDNPLMLYDLDMSSQWRIEDEPGYAAWLPENLEAASEYLYGFSAGQIALGNVTVRQDWDGWEDADIRLHAHNYMRPNATLGGVNHTPVPDPDNDQLPPEIEGEIVYWPGIIRIGAAWNRYNSPEPETGFPEDVSKDWAMVLGHELGHYLLYLRDTYFRIGPDNTIINVYSCIGSAMGWVYLPENHGFIADPDHWEENCRDTYGNDLLNRSEWATLTRFFPWLQSPDSQAEPFTDPLPAGVTTIELIPAAGESPGTPNQPVELLYEDEESASSRARAFLFREERIIDQGGPAEGTTSVTLLGSQVGDRLCLIDIDPTPQEPASPRHQFGCEPLVEGENALPLRKDVNWAPTILVTPVTTLTLDIEITQPAENPLVARLYPEDTPGWIETPLQPVETQTGTASETVSGTFQYSQPVMSAFVQVYVDEPDMPGLPRREAIIDYGANGGGLPGPTSSFGHAPVISSSDGRAVFLLTEGVTLGEGEFIAWQSMIGRPPIPPTLEQIDQPYRLIALPRELVDSGVVSIRYPTLSTTAGAASAAQDEPPSIPPGAALHFYDGSSWQELKTEFVEDPNGDIIASAASRGVGVYTLLIERTSTIYFPYMGKMRQ